MNFHERLETSAKDVETHLAAWLAPERIGPVPPRLLDAMRHGTLGGGKRFRPFLVLQCAALFGMAQDRAMNAAAALECIHCYSLIHDDLPAMDDDDMRRGQPTVHKAFDEATAILAGDALLTLAFEIAAHPQTHPNAAVRSALCLHLARASGAAGMVGGQMLDLEAPGKTLGEADILQLQRMKTGRLLVFACEAGAILGEAAEADADALRAFGNALGSAFQLADDLLDAEGDAAVVGKATGKDAEAGKATLVSLQGAEASRFRLQNLRDEAVFALERFRPRESVLVEATDFVIARKF